MNRRDFLKLTAAGAAALSMSNMALSAASTRNKPNVLFMAIGLIMAWYSLPWLYGHFQAGILGYSRTDELLREMLPERRKIQFPYVNK